MVLLWPTAQGKQKEIDDLLRRNGDIVYFKEVYLNNNGAHSITALAYKREPWVGNAGDSFAGASGKALNCFSENGPLRVYLFEPHCDLVELKEQIRAIFMRGKHSVHINDTHAETIELTKALFNENSVQLLNFGVHAEFSWFNRLFEHYTKWLKERGFDQDKFCIDGSGVLAAFGIRDVRDLDFLYSGDSLPNSGYNEIDCHNLECQHKDLEIHEIVNNPKNHFYFKEYKFVSIDLILAMKKIRNEIKDQQDVEKIEALKKGALYVEPLYKKVRRVTSLPFIKARIKLSLLKIRYYITRMKHLLIND